MNPIVLLVLFIVATAAGYRIIGSVPSLLHTPLMSGMNALSGITLLGGLAVLAAAAATGSRALGIAAVILATVNVVGGFMVTHRMLRMFKSSRIGKRTAR